MLGLFAPLERSLNLCQGNRQRHCSFISEQRQLKSYGDTLKRFFFLNESSHAREMQVVELDLKRSYRNGYNKRARSIESVEKTIGRQKDSHLSMEQLNHSESVQAYPRTVRLENFKALFLAYFPEKVGFAEIRTAHIFFYFQYIERHK